MLRFVGFLICFLFCSFPVFAQSENECKPVVSRSLQVLVDQATDLAAANRQPRQRDIERMIDRISSYMDSNNDLCPKEVSALLEFRSAFYLMLQPPRYGDTLADLERILELDALQSLNMAKAAGLAASIYFLYEFDGEAERVLKQHIARRTNANTDTFVQRHTWYRLAAAYYMQEQFESARSAAEKAVYEPEFEAERAFFPLLDNIYQQLGMQKERQNLYSEYQAALPGEQPWAFDLPLTVESSSVAPMLSRADIKFVQIWEINRDAEPKTRFPPAYPDQCQDRVGVTGDKRVTVEFDVSKDGKPQDTRIVSSDARCLDQYAEEAVLKWEYLPKKLNGEPLVRKNVRTTFVFRLVN
ncbi:MAG: energy transducer TonB [Aquisalinus sp.]|nr:energy transducer TonB [Aquisalinus sp.]